VGNKPALAALTGINYGGSGGGAGRNLGEKNHGVGKLAVGSVSANLRGRGATGEDKARKGEKDKRWVVRLERETPVNARHPKQSDLVTQKDEEL